MEYVPGATVRDVLRAQGPLPISVALQVVDEVAEALEMAWSAESAPGRPLHLLHRDIKPSNLQLTDQGDIKILDFGVARADFGGREAQTQQVVYGSPPYLSPERLAAQDTPAGDVFAVGATLAEMVTGLRPDPAVTSLGAHEERIGKLVDAVDALQDPSLSRFVADMLAYAPERRPSMSEVQQKAHALRKRHKEPEIRPWARTAIPRVQADRQLHTGELSGRALEESTAQPANLAELPGAASRTWEPDAGGSATLPPLSDPSDDVPEPVPPAPDVVSIDQAPVAPHDESTSRGEQRASSTPHAAPPPAPTPAPEPSSGGFLKGVVATTVLGLGTVGVVSVVSIGAVVLVLGLACWGSWGAVYGGVCTDSIEDMDRALDRAVSERDAVDKARTVTRALDAACRRGDLAFIDLIQIETQLEEDLVDGQLSLGEQVSLRRRTEKTLGIQLDP